MRNRDEKWLRHTNKICKITGLVSIFWNNKTKKVPMPKLSLLVQIGGKISISTVMLRWLHPNPSKIGLIRSKPILERFVWSYQTTTVLTLIFPPVCNSSLIFGIWIFFMFFFLNMPTKKLKYFSTLEEKFRISARPCNILYLVGAHEA